MKKFVACIVFVLLVGSGIWVFFQQDKKFTVNVDRTAVVKEIKSLHRLETASFTVEKIIDAGTNGSTFQELLFGDRILLIAHGEVIAGFDLSQMDENDIILDGTIVRLQLPAPQILVSRLDNEQTRVYDRRQGFLTKGDVDLESEARKAAEETIRNAACSGGILQQASENGRKQLHALFKSLQFSTVIIDIPEGGC